MNSLVPLQHQALGNSGEESVYWAVRTQQRPRQISNGLSISPRQTPPPQSLSQALGLGLDTSSSFPLASLAPEHFSGSLTGEGHQVGVHHQHRNGARQ